MTCICRTAPYSTTTHEGPAGTTRAWCHVHCCIVVYCVSRSHSEPWKRAGGLCAALARCREIACASDSRVCPSHTPRDAPTNERLQAVSADAAFRLPRPNPVDATTRGVKPAQKNRVDIAASAHSRQEASSRPTPPLPAPVKRSNIAPRLTLHRCGTPVFVRPTRQFPPRPAISPAARQRLTPVSGRSSSRSSSSIAILHMCD